MQALPNLDVSRETQARLERYAELLLKWNRKINLVAQSSLNDLWTRHITDSTQLFQLAKTAGHWVDLGSGGGFPGMVIGILASDHAGWRVTLVEADQRKAAFLRTVAREIGVSVSVVPERIESLKPQNADYLSARALASLSDLLFFAERHLANDGVAIFPKGEKAEAEMSEALERWRFSCEKHPSITDARSTVLCIGDISRV